ncbi:MAG: hypothetical protein IKW85_12190 [Muribaculaceae bacterium]|nr:hypothetical protein [Muribaculaceae bacterium]
MKNIFLIAAATIISLPLFNSCGDPSGQPKNDAENWKGLAEKSYKLNIEFLEKKLEMAEYYAKKEDPEGYKEFLKELDKREKEIREDFYDDHEEEFDDIKERTIDAEEDMREKRNKEENYRNNH